MVSISRASLILSIQPVDFTALKPQSRKFFVELFTHIFASTQLTAPVRSSAVDDLPMTRNRGPLEDVFMKAAKFETLALGLVFFLGQQFRQGLENDFLEWAVNVSMQTLRAGVDRLSLL